MQAALRLAAMLRARLLLLPSLCLGLLAAKAVASGPEAAITRAAVAPFQDALRHDAAALCGDLVPAVAAELVTGVSPTSGCEAAVSREFASTAPNEPPAGAGRSLEATVQDVEVSGLHATVKVTLALAADPGKPGTTTSVGLVAPIRLELEEVGGVWLVSSRAKLGTVPGCLLPKPRRCHSGAHVLVFSAGEIETVQPGEELPRPLVPQRESPEVEAGRLDVARSGCLACHRIDVIWSLSCGLGL
jgi:hypothetical protein